jgi:HAD superfamily hydrolase (TIGR01509 family)
MTPSPPLNMNVEKVIAVRDRVANELKSSVIDLEQVRLESFKQTLRSVGRPNDELAEQITNFYIHHRHADIEPFGDVMPTLTALYKRYTVGALTNGNSHPERVGIGHVFDFAILASEQEVSKPDPRIFHIAAEMAGCEPSELLHVGDDLTDDIEGAIAAGLQAVWINRNGQLAVPENPPRFQISTLSTLLEWLIE